MIDVPQQVRNTALATGNSAWLDELPALVASLEADWSITVGRTLRGGNEAYVAFGDRLEAHAGCGVELGDQAP